MEVSLRGAGSLSSWGLVLRVGVTQCNMSEISTSVQAVTLKECFLFVIPVPHTKSRRQISVKKFYLTVDKQEYHGKMESEFFPHWLFPTPTHLAL